MLQASTQNTFQERLNHLFASTRATYRDVVDGTGGVIRETYLWQLRTGRGNNPSNFGKINYICLPPLTTFVACLLYSPCVQWSL